MMPCLRDFPRRRFHGVGFVGCIGMQRNRLRERLPGKWFPRRIAWPGTSMKGMGCPEP